MTNLTTVELNTLKAEELRTIAKEFQMVGAWKAKKDEMISFLENIKSNQIEAERIAAEQAAQNEEVKPERTSTSRKGRTRVINVFKDGELINTIEGLMETFKWATENSITNVGWVKRSLKNNEETQAGYKYKNGGGYLFQYAN